MALKVEKVDGKKKNGEVRVKSTPAFKLKDKAGKTYQIINLKMQFGFIPEIIIVEKVYRANNALIVRAVMTEEELKKEEAARAIMTKKEGEPIATK